jgi:hypothetical protein
VENDTGPFTDMFWVKLSAPEARRKALELYKQAASLQASLNLGGVGGAQAREQEVRAVAPFCCVHIISARSY